MYPEVKVVCKSFVSSLEYAMKMINFRKVLTKEQQVSYENAKWCYICKEKFEMNIWRIKKS